MQSLDVCLLANDASNDRDQNTGYIWSRQGVSEATCGCQCLKEAFVRMWFVLIGSACRRRTRASSWTTAWKPSSASWTNSACATRAAAAPSPRPPTSPRRPSYTLYIYIYLQYCRCKLNRSEVSRLKSKKPPYS